MRTTIKFLISLATIATTMVSCAKSITDSTNLAAARAFNAWIATHNIGQQYKFGHGDYLITDIPGNGAEVVDSAYLFIRYKCYTLEDSTIVSYTYEDIAKQMGTYSQGNYYGSDVLYCVKSNVPTGLLDILMGGPIWTKAGGEWKVTEETLDPMCVGGKRTGILPGWLTSTSYDYSATPEGELQYIADVTGSDYHYTIEVLGLTMDIDQWQRDTIRKAIEKAGMEYKDTIPGGIWYYRDYEREAQRGVTVREDYKFPDDTTIYIDYIGRLIDGKVFDTTIKDTAKRYGIYSAENSYEPVSITWSSDSTGIQMSSSSVITGFSLTLWQMHPYESGHGIFTSDKGYGASGNSPTIPSYAPLIFDIDIVDAPE